jgi:rRNA maturation endonuclease Nob1
MPTFKHPCPHCGKYIQRDVAMCPFCGTRDPFAPARCPKCRTVIEDPSWVACPKCGQSLKPEVAETAAAKTAADQALNPPARPQPQPGPAPATSASPPAAVQAPPNQSVNCTGCGAPLAAGAKFCTVCGTLAA